MEKTIKNLERLEREIVRNWPLTGSVSSEREKGIGVLVRGSMTDEIERDRVSRVRWPV